MVTSQEVKEKDRKEATMVVKERVREENNNGILRIPPKSSRAEKG